MRYLWTSLLVTFFFMNFLPGPRTGLDVSQKSAHVAPLTSQGQDGAGAEGWFS